MSPSNGFESDRYAPRRAAEPGTPVGAGCAAVAIVRSSVFSELLGHEVEVEGGQDEVQEEEQQERDDHGLVDGVADALRTALRVEALVTSNHAADEAEQRRLDQGHEQIGELGELVEGGEVRAGRPVLDHDAE